MKRMTRLGFYSSMRFYELKQLHKPKYIINTGLKLMRHAKSIEFFTEPATREDPVFGLSYDDSYEPFVINLLDQGHSLTSIFQTAVAYAHKTLLV